MNARLSLLACLAMLVLFAAPVEGQQTPEELLQSALYKQQVAGDLEGAVEILQTLIDDFPEHREIAASALVLLGRVHETLGSANAERAYQRVLNDYPDQRAAVAEARTRLAEIERSAAELNRTSTSVSREAAHRATFRRFNFPNRLGWDAQLSPDGRSIALVNEGKLWIVPTSSSLGPGFPGTPRLLDTEGIRPMNVGFAWSGDGQWIAFNGKPADWAVPADTPTARIYVIPANGGEPREIYETNRDARVVNYRMSLSPDGETIAFTSLHGDELHLHAMSVAGGEARLLLETPAREPVFSPDGTMIAFVEVKSKGTAGGGLWVVPASGGLPTLVADAGNASTPVWSPDGKMLAFVDNASSNKIHIIELGPDGSPIGEKVSIDCPEEIDEVRRLAGWTPDNVITAIGAIPIEFALFAQPVEGGKARFVAHGGYPTQPRWSPDGQRILHVNNADSTSGDWQSYALAYLPADGGDVTTVPLRSQTKIRLGAYGAGARLSPAGRTIVFAGQTQDEGGRTRHIWTLPIEGGEPRQLTDAPLNDSDPFWSPDGRNVAFVRATTPSDNWAGIGKSNIFIVSADGGDARQLTSDPDGVFPGPVVWSPDGTHLAYFSSHEDDTDLGTIKIIPADGGEPRVVTEVRHVFVNKELAWSPDSRRIAFNAYPFSNSIKIVSLDDGSIEEIVPDLEDVEELYHLDWSPDGKTLVFGGYSGGGPQLWLISDFLPEGR